MGAAGAPSRQDCSNGRVSTRMFWNGTVVVFGSLKEALACAVGHIPQWLFPGPDLAFYRYAIHGDRLYVEDGRRRLGFRRYRDGLLLSDEWLYSPVRESGTFELHGTCEQCWHIHWRERGKSWLGEEEHCRFRYRLRARAGRIVAVKAVRKDTIGHLRALGLRRGRVPCPIDDGAVSMCSNPGRCANQEAHRRRKWPSR